MKTKTVYRLAGAAALAAGAVFAKKNEDRRREEEEKKFSPPGVMVEVDGKRMHVLITPPAKSPEGEKPDGSSSQVIVMLPGLGTPGPSLDFLPLAKKLAEKGFLCVSPEPFGYGFSDDMASPRTPDAMIEEIRTALRQLEIPAPYILHGHSIAGFYIRVWADKYPEEVCGLIGEDISVPEQIGAFKGEEMRMIIKQALIPVMQKTSQFGLDRFFASNSDSFGRSAHNDPEVISLLRFVARKNRYSNALQDENKRFADAAKQTSKCSMPSCPFLLFVATGEGSASQMKFKNGFSWLQAHLDLANTLPNGKAVELPGMHYLHWDFADEMAEETAAFFQTGSFSSD